MTFTVYESTVVPIRQDDPMFKITDGLCVYPRAGLHILPECPSHVRDIIQTATAQGWLKTVAYMHDYEKTFALLKNE